MSERDDALLILAKRKPAMGGSDDKPAAPSGESLMEEMADALRAKDYAGAWDALCSAVGVAQSDAKGAKDPDADDKSYI